MPIKITNLPDLANINDEDLIIIQENQNASKVTSKVTFGALKIKLLSFVPAIPGFSSQQEALDGTNNNTIMTPLRVTQKLAAFLSASFSTNQQAIDGTNNSTIMTPLRVAEKIAAAGGGGQSLSLATNAQAIAGTDNTTVMTPLRVQEKITASTPAPIVKTAFLSLNNVALASLNNQPGRVIIPAVAGKTHIPLQMSVVSSDTGTQYNAFSFALFSGNPFYGFAYQYLLKTKITVFPTMTHLSVQNQNESYLQQNVGQPITIATITQDNSGWQDAYNGTLIFGVYVTYVTVG